MMEFVWLTLLVLMTIVAALQNATMVTQRGIIKRQCEQLEVYYWAIRCATKQFQRSADGLQEALQGDEQKGNTHDE